MLEETNVVGFYKIPNFAKYGIAKNGDVVNLKEGRVLRPIRHFRGYIRFVLVNDQGERVSMARHRLMGLVFIPCPGNPEEMLINHKNLTPGDDRIENLEWCTHAENMEHAVKHSVNRDKIPVERRNPVTGEVVLFNNRVDCANASKLTISQLLWRLEASPARTFPEEFQYRLYGDTRPWGNGEVADFGRKKEIQVRDLITDREYSFSSQREAAAFMKVSEGALSIWLNDESQPVVDGLKQVKYFEREWRVVDNAVLDYEAFSKRRAVVMIDDTSLEAFVYIYAGLCAEKNNIKPTLLNYRLMSKGEKVWPDGKRYLYYTDYLNSKWSAVASNPTVSSP